MNHFFFFLAFKDVRYNWMERLLMTKYVVAIDLLSRMTLSSKLIVTSSAINKKLDIYKKKDE